MTQYLKTSDLNFYLRPGLNTPCLQSKFVIDQSRAAVALVRDMYFTDREVSPRHRSLSLQPLRFSVDKLEALTYLILSKTWA